jgi:hypothetical protein
MINNHLLVLVVIMIIMLIFYPQEDFKDSVKPDLDQQYVGCFQDGRHRQMRGLKDYRNYYFRIPKMTRNDCVSHCKQKGFQYAGLQHGTACFCDNGPEDKLGRRLPEKRCNMPCPGEPGKKCGSGLVNSVYRTSSKRKKSSEDKSELELVGCHKDDGDRFLKGKQYSFVNNSPELCASHCRDSGYKYAGVQNGNQCFCDNEPIRGLGEKRPLVECEKPCPSDKSKFCGDQLRNRIYKTGLGGEFADDNGDEDYISSDYITFGVPQGTPSCNCNKPEYLKNAPKEEDVNSYQGCYRETPEENLKYKVFPEGTSQLTPKKCQYLCRNHGYKYAGVTFGNECWCGNGEKGLGERRPEWECNSPCSGAPDQNCGGILRQNIYQVKG